MVGLGQMHTIPTFSTQGRRDVFRTLLMIGQKLLNVLVKGDRGVFRNC